ncbi:hypothetical protein [Azonexus hydrophilus]|uniref:Nucleotidyl transferase AbiEii/AbiGii toxin family protein n=1 Tax=Azonexus hydrophilus TaxID=418702 RepID=A0ABZ2XFI6_9RHOO
MTAEVEVSIPKELLTKILKSVTPEAVLVGGQSLAFWVSYYGIQLPEEFQVGAISDDADFLGGRADLAAIAKSVASTPEYTSLKVISSLVGQVKIPVSKLEYVNVDVLHKLVGLNSGDVRERATRVTVDNVDFLVMHPFDVFVSRIENLAVLAEKQNSQGVEQAKLGVLVARHFIEEIARNPDNGQKHALRLIERVVKLAKKGHGRKVTRDFGIDFRGAVPGYSITSEKFKEIRYPQILAELRPVASGSVDVITRAAFPSAG